MKKNYFNIPAFPVDSKVVPQYAILPLFEGFRYCFAHRREFRNATLSIDAFKTFINNWWTRHQNIIRAASMRPEWDWKTLSLHFDKDVSRPVNFYLALRDFLTLLGRPSDRAYETFIRWNFNTELPPIYSASSDYYLGEFHGYLYKVFFDCFKQIILENVIPTLDTMYSSSDANLSATMVNSVKDLINSHFDTETHTTMFARAISELLGSSTVIPFNKIPKAIFDKTLSLRGSDDNYINFVRSLHSIFDNYREDFICEIFKSVGAHQMSGSIGPVKTTLSNKLLKCYYDWLTALTIGFSGNQWNLIDNNFDYYLNQMKSFVFYTDVPFKIRNEGHEGFQLVSYGTYDQLFARLQENVKGSISKESFIVSFHPCDMITCSLGYHWSSCQSFIDMFEDLPSGAGSGNTYSGMYNGGNFQFMSGNGFIAYVPDKVHEDLPQFLWPKKKRCLLWVGDNLDCMRQNFFYPGKPSDQETLAFGKVIREYLQDVFSPFNFSNGTMDWTVKSGRDWASQADGVSSRIRIDERYDPNGGIRYDDPIMAISVLKTVTETPVLHYALNFPRFDTGLVSTTRGRNAAFFAHTSNVCPVCGKHTSAGGYCSKCSKELVEHNGRRVHPKELVSIKIDGVAKYFDLSEYEQLTDYFVGEDGTAMEFKSAFKVFMPSGIKYFKELPDYVKKCKVCGEYFHPSFMIGDVCIEHFNAFLTSDDATSDNIVVNVDEVLKAFIAHTLSFDCNDTDNLIALLHLLEAKGYRWVSGVSATSYVPRTSASKRMYLSLNDNDKLILSSQAKSTVIKLSNLFSKGGE